jgi:hypothetical protein
LAPWASSWPDGLDAAGEQVGFNDLGRDHVLAFSDYVLPLPVGWEAWSVAGAGVLGTLAVWGVGWLISRSGSAPLSSEPPHVG